MHRVSRTLHSVVAETPTKNSRQGMFAEHWCTSQRLLTSPCLHEGAYKLAHQLLYQSVNVGERFTNICVRAHDQTYICKSLQHHPSAIESLPCNVHGPPRDARHPSSTTLSARANYICALLGLFSSVLDSTIELSKVVQMYTFHLLFSIYSYNYL